MGMGAKQAIGVLVAMVVLLATGPVPSSVAGLLAAGALILLGVVSVEQSYRAINWTTVIMIGAMMPLSTAMAQSGAADMLGESLVRLVGDAGPYALLGGLFLLDRNPRPADQQHGHRPDHHPDRGGGRDRRSACRHGRC